MLLTPTVFSVRTGSVFFAARLGIQIAAAVQMITEQGISSVAKVAGLSPAQKAHGKVGERCRAKY